jgi:hypothetical protein
MIQRNIKYILSQTFLCNTIWMPSILAISYTMNTLWFHLISKTNMFQSFHTPTRHPLTPSYRYRLSNRRVSHDLSIDDLKPHDVIATYLHLNITPPDHVIIGNLDIIDNKNHYSFKLLMDYVEDNRRKRTKRKKGRLIPCEYDLKL